MNQLHKGLIHVSAVRHFVSLLTNTASSPIRPVTGTDSTIAVNANTLDFTNSPSVEGVPQASGGFNQNMFGVNLGQVHYS